VFLRLGNQLISWGPSAIWTPVDFINLQRLNPLSPLDLRVGKPGLRIHVPLGISNVFLFGDFSGTVSGSPTLVVNAPLTTAMVRPKPKPASLMLPATISVGTNQKLEGRALQHRLS